MKIAKQLYEVDKGYILIGKAGHRTVYYAEDVVTGVPFASSMKSGASVFDQKSTAKKYETPFWKAFHARFDGDEVLLERV